MKYVVDVGGEAIEVVLDGGGVRVGETHLPAHLEQLEGTPVHLVRIGEAVHRVAVQRGETRGAYTLWIDGHRFVVEALDERTRAIRDLTGAATAAAGPKPLVAPMPGLIVRIHVAVGDHVEVGRPLVAMEAMKMENELRAPSAGVVKAIAVTPGQPVEKGAVLVEME